MHRSTHLILRVVLIILLFASVGQGTGADWKGRFDLGGSPTFYDDNQLEDRTPITSRLRLQYAPENADQWLFTANIKLRSEFNSEDGNKWRVRDLFIRYGTNPDKNPLSVTAGLFQPRNISGVGDVIGAGLRYSMAISETTRLGLGTFGGANAVILDGGTDSDGLRLGAYAVAHGSQWGQASLSYVSVTDTDLAGDERDYLGFATTLRLGDRFDFYQSGEYTLSSEAGEENALTYYYANAGYDVSDMIRFSITYDLYDRLPYLASVPDDTDDPGQTPDDFDRYAAYKGQSIGPRVDLRFSSNWRLYGRYRYRQTDDFQEQTWHQYLLGFGCADLAGSGFGVNGSVFVNRGDTKEYETGFLTISRDFNSALSMSLNLAADRFAYPETVASAAHVESSYRAGVSGFYRFNRKMTAILEYERTFGDDDSDSDHRVFFNWQYRF